MTAICINMPNFPFLTLTESKMNNCWYHDHMDFLFTLTEEGFMKTNGSKKKLIKNRLI